MHFNKIPGIRHFCSERARPKPDIHVTLPQNWDRWAPGKADTADAFFSRVNFVKHVERAVVGTAQQVADLGRSATVGHIHLGGIDANEHHLPDDALHFPQYTGHFADVDMHLDRASGELQDAALTVRRYEGHQPRQFSITRQQDQISFTHNGRTVSVGPNGALQES